jgi:hypothetical protein
MILTAVTNNEYRRRSGTNCNVSCVSAKMAADVNEKEEKAADRFRVKNYICGIPSESSGALWMLHASP